MCKIEKKQGTKLGFASNELGFVVALRRCRTIPCLSQTAISGSSRIWRSGGAKGLQATHCGSEGPCAWSAAWTVLALWWSYARLVRTLMQCKTSPAKEGIWVQTKHRPRCCSLSLPSPTVGRYSLLLHLRWRTWTKQQAQRVSKDQDKISMSNPQPSQSGPLCQTSRKAIAKLKCPSSKCVAENQLSAELHFVTWFDETSCPPLLEKACLGGFSMLQYQLPVYTSCPSVVYSKGSPISQSSFLTRSRGQT